MQILNIRNGFATNSSSSHSVIMLDAPDPSIESSEDTDFGWQFFTAASVQAKANYLKATLLGNIGRSLSWSPGYSEVRRYSTTLSLELLNPLLQAWIPESDSSITGVDKIYVDHQSLIELPNNFSPFNAGPSQSFFNDLKKVILDPRVIILGGNDNDGDCHPLSYRGKHILKDVPTDGNSNTVCRKDGDWWTLFNKDNGNRSTFSFEANPSQIVKFSAPLLADVKITDWCDKGCSFCYQNSTPEGKHADMNNVYKVIKDLEDMQVFEVALGGGEVTAHPRFGEILEAFRYRGIVPNFTTRNLFWMTDPKQKDLQKAVKEYVGAIAYSVSNPEEVATFADSLNFFYGEKNIYQHRNRHAVHVIPALLTEDQFKAIIEAVATASLQVTLLGYKRVGRGKSGSPSIDYDWYKVIQEVRKHHYFPKVSIDTAMARSYVDILTQIDPQRIMWFTDEGNRSMYVDAVEMKVAPSSYSAQKSFIKITKNRAIKDIFPELSVEN